LKGFLKITGLKYDSVKNTLNKLTLLSDGKLLNAAVILFGKKPQSIFPNAKLRCAVGMRLEGLRRVDVPEIDKEAFREAIINAFCHRDYYEYDSVNIAVFKDRVEVRSPGLLYGGLTIDQIKREMASERRNELIAAFKRA
jgi:ATP-dependent DNA helicase RecG